jgi:hypothetical protein
VPVYRPLSPDKPLEIVHAEVRKDRESFLWNGVMQDVWYVEYRADGASDVGGDSHPKGAVWVRAEDGVVLQQQVMLFDSPLMFVRMTEQEAKDLTRRLTQREGRHWWSVENESQVKSHD